MKRYVLRALDDVATRADRTTSRPIRRRHALTAKKIRGQMQRQMLKRWLLRAVGIGKIKPRLRRRLMGWK